MIKAAIALLMVAGVVAVAVDNALPHQAAVWAQQEVQSLSSAEPSASTRASGELAHARPSPTPTATATDNPNAAPITLITPRPAAATLPNWTPADCAWAENVMAWDQSLDAAEAQRIASGQDTRYGTSPAVVQYYVTYAADWETALGQIKQVCDGTGMPSAAEQAATVQAFSTAIAAHQADAASKAPD